MGDPRQPPASGPLLLEAHLRSLDPNTLTAAERLYAKIGRDFARKLVFGLVRGAGSGSRAA